MDSIEGFLSSHIGDGTTLSKSSYQDDSFHKRASDSDSHFIGRYLHLDSLTSNHLKSDSESGFDESSSQMSRSGFDDGGYYPGMDSSTVKRSHSAEHITMEQLIAEMKTVAIVWKSFCKVQSCSCATPLEYHVKKVNYAYCTFTRYVCVISFNIFYFCCDKTAIWKTQLNIWSEALFEHITDLLLLSPDNLSKCSTLSLKSLHSKQVKPIFLTYSIPESCYFLPLCPNCYFNWVIVALTLS